MADKKKKSKIKENDIKLILFLLGFAAMGCSHMLVYQPLQEDIELRLTDEIAAQTAEKERLNAVGLRLPVLMEETEANQIIVENELLKYPEDVLPETFMYYADNLRDQLDVTISAVTVSESALINKIDILRREGENDVSTPIAQYLTTLSFAWEFSYPQLKSFIEYVHADRERTVVNNLSISYNAGTGQLTGNTLINKYFIATPSYVYEAPDLPLVDSGTDNPFGTMMG